MLAMTQAAGKQITPLLNMQVKTPNYSVFDEQLKGLTKTVDEYVAAQVESAKAATTQSGATDDAGHKTEDSGKKHKKAGEEVEKHSMSLRHMKRDSIETFGAISFLVQNIVQLADKAAGGDQKLQKMSSSMAQGISAGFGLASTIALLGVATGGTAVFIGAAVAIGTSLLTFFSDSETRAKLGAAAIDTFKRSLRGASVEALEEYRNSLTSAIKADKDYIKTTNELLSSSQRVADFIRTNGNGAFVKLQQSVSDAEKRIEENKKRRETLETEISDKQLTEMEVRKRTSELEVQAIENKFTQMRKEVDRALDEENKAADNSTATNEKKNAMKAAAAKAHQLKIKQIDDEERQEKDQHTLRLAEIEDRRRLAVMDVAEKLELATAKTEIERLAIQERYATQRLQVEEEAAKRSIQLEIKRLQAMPGEESDKKNARLNQVLVAMDKEAGDKRAAVRSATNEKLAQLDQQNQTAIRDLQKQTILTQLDAEEKQALASETNEERRTEITRKFALLRLQVEKDAAQYSVQIEIDRLEAFMGPLQEFEQTRLRQLREWKQKSDELFGAKKLDINVDANIKVLPVGSVAAQLQKIQDLQNEFNRETDAGARARISNELRYEQSKLDRMTLFGDELVQKERDVQKQRRQLWAETHQVQMAFINSLLAGSKSLWDQLIRGQEQTSRAVIDLRDRENALAEKQLRKEKQDLQKQLKDKEISQEDYNLKLEQLELSAAQRAQSNLEFQKKLDDERRSSLAIAYDAMKQTVFDALGAILQKQIENYLIDLFTKKAVETEKVAATTASAVAQSAVVTAALVEQNAAAIATMAVLAASVVATMDAITLAAIPAATLVSIATFGGAAAAGEAAILASLLATKAAAMAMKIPGFEMGGKTKKGQAGFIEGFYPEIIAPEKDFYHIARTEIIPQMLMEQDRQLDVKFSKNMTAKFQAAGGTSNNAEVLAALKNIADKIDGLALVSEIEGTKIKTMLRNVNYNDRRAGKN